VVQRGCDRERKVFKCQRGCRVIIATVAFHSLTNLSSKKKKKKPVDAAVYTADAWAMKLINVYTADAWALNVPRFALITRQP